ncbi:Uncharacterised protein [Weeksella virosa]|uniref:Uncharacterized protein n=1 Tax=Weeksella virosa (strain ATCC 43766 / DSM 16922 / JCM 21250 / CCUG 30538 / CDC 9751 / IAM 14551 / NBRC 16016 / NCTC 11634 / CL345/78) TaxID=865938 RepID=F0P1M7_WEEVC|nr:hypothetical protein Weevi_0945 [Weeksella virosa DSM 16922]VEH64720.1 Uncharacterised protein [Weeksella virosa]
MLVEGNIYTFFLYPLQKKSIVSNPFSNRKNGIKKAGKYFPAL